MSGPRCADATKSVCSVAIDADTAFGKLAARIEPSHVWVAVGGRSDLVLWRVQL